MFLHRRKQKNKLDDILNSLVKNEISVTTGKSNGGGDICRSKFGGRPAVPEDFEWPRYEAKNFDGVLKNRPLSFMCQINLDDVSGYDKDELLPKTGLLLFFYEQETMCWGFDPEDKGCSRVYYFADTAALHEAELPADLGEDYRVREYELSFAARASYPCFEEFDCCADSDIEWEDYDEAVEAKGYELDNERHKLLGYADLVKGEMLTECERVSRDLYCGDAESYGSTPDDTEKEILKAASDWVLLFQMASIEDDDYELMFGDVGDIYYYIRKQDLTELRFDKTWLVLQCG